ncbi:thiol reductant ABC exporter subunit CydC [Terrilactibacillus laevilacticus]|uniref:Thiol reductant ABC exporter subunit CydC n=1 Tax=Terrilactibacillus laevilacticus TaxID=1380157 RepID=A0ABW5PQG5_9BACI|nr:thiol reductant ABC exporter subunit CydC [Terrilactibacillus laevilacticus]
MKEWFIDYIKRYWRRFIVIVIVSILAVLCGAALMFTSGYLISKAALRPENVLMIYVPIVAVRTFGIGRAAIQYIARLTSHDATLRILSEMRIQLYKILEPRALFIRSKVRTGNILGLLSDDIEHLQDIYLRTIFPSIVALSVYFIVIFSLGWFSIPFALIMAIYLFILIVFFPLVSLWITKRKSQEINHQRNHLYQSLTDAVLGVSDLMISGRSKAFIRNHEMDETEITKIESSLHSMSQVREFISQGIIGLIVISMIVWSSGMANTHQIPGTLIAAFVLVVFTLGEIFIPISESTEKISQYQTSLDRLQETSHFETEDSKNEIENVSLHQKVTICLDHVHFRHDNESDWAINDLSLTIKQGEKIAIIGRSGAGKSSLIKLIYGALQPERGTITLNGIPANHFGDKMSKMISVLNQTPYLFDTTIRNNIRLGHQQASDEDIKRAAKQAKLDEYIESLPLGYQSAVDEMGENFSGGQRQRLALARVLLQNTPIVLMDEPTVGLDPSTEKELLETIFEAMKGKTLIWVTHHLVGADKMDKVIFMEQGKIEMQGHHRELMNQFERYRRLYQLDVPYQL